MFFFVTRPFRQSGTTVMVLNRCGVTPRPLWLPGRLPRHPGLIYGPTTPPLELLQAPPDPRCESPNHFFFHFPYFSTPKSQVSMEGMVTTSFTPWLAQELERHRNGRKRRWGGVPRRWASPQLSDRSRGGPGSIYHDFSGPRPPERSSNKKNTRF